MRWRPVIALAVLGLAPGDLARAQSTAAPATASAQSPRMAVAQRDRFRAAIAALRAGDTARAAHEFGDPAWAGTPLDDYASLFRAQALVRAGDAAGARAAATHAVDGAPDASPTGSVLLDAADVLSAAGDDAAAAALYQRFLDRHPDRSESPRARYALGRSQLANGRIGEASQTLRDLWRQAPASPEAEDAARQLRVLDERGLGGAQATAQDRVERAERLLAAGRSDAARSELDSLGKSALGAELGDRILKVQAGAARRAGR